MSQEVLRSSASMDFGELRQSRLRLDGAQDGGGSERCRDVLGSVPQERPAIHVTFLNTSS